MLEFEKDKTRPTVRGLLTALGHAGNYATHDASSEILPKHLLLATLINPSVRRMIRVLRPNVQALHKDILKKFNINGAYPRQYESNPPIGRIASDILDEAVTIAQALDVRDARSLHLFAALTDKKSGPISDLLAGYRITKPQIIHLLEAERGSRSERVNTSEQAVERAITATAKTAPVLVPVRGRLIFRQSDAIGRITERKRLATDRYEDAHRLLASRSNEQPELARLVGRYGQALTATRKDRGVYRLFIAGLEIETLLRAKAQAPVDDERNPPLDADILFATQSLIVAHAGLIALFPDANHLIAELDQYRQQSEALDALRNRILEPVLSALAHSNDLFDANTKALTETISDFDDESTREFELPTPTRGATAAKHAWLRGTLSAIGTYMLKQCKAISRAARDAVVRISIEHIAKSSGLSLAIASFLTMASNELIELGKALQPSFGWLLAFLSLLGIG